MRNRQTSSASISRKFFARISKLPMIRSGRTLREADENVGGDFYTRRNSVKLDIVQAIHRNCFAAEPARIPGKKSDLPEMMGQMTQRKAPEHVSLRRWRDFLPEVRKVFREPLENRTGCWSPAELLVYITDREAPLCRAMPSLT